MGFELIYTSVPQGLKPGTRGFATVAFTQGMPANYVQACEALSGYIHVFPAQDPRYVQNPVAYSYYQFRIGGQPVAILSRVSAYGTDYSGRNNTLAHHVVLQAAEFVEAGPAAVMCVDHFFREEWASKPHLIGEPKSIPQPPQRPFRATAWEQLTGDGGWAGVIAARFLTEPDKPIFMLFTPGMQLLPLIAEVFALIPPQSRWALTFNTYFTALPAGSTCCLRCCLPDADALRAARRAPNTLVVDLNRPLGTAPGTDRLVTCARTGESPPWTQAVRPPEVPVAPPTPAHRLPARSQRSPRTPRILKQEPPKVWPAENILRRDSKTALLAGLAAGLVMGLVLAFLVLSSRTLRTPAEGGAKTNETMRGTESTNLTPTPLQAISTTATVMQPQDVAASAQTGAHTSVVDRSETMTATPDTPDTRTNQIGTSHRQTRRSVELYLFKSDSPVPWSSTSPPARVRPCATSGKATYTPVDKERDSGIAAAPQEHMLGTIKIQPPGQKPVDVTVRWSPKTGQVKLSFIQDLQSVALDSETNTLLVVFKPFKLTGADFLDETNKVRVAYRVDDDTRLELLGDLLIALNQLGPLSSNQALRALFQDDNSRSATLLDFSTNFLTCRYGPSSKQIDDLTSQIQDLEQKKQALSNSWSQSQSTNQPPEARAASAGQALDLMQKMSTNNIADNIQKQFAKAREKVGRLVQGGSRGDWNANKFADALKKQPDLVVQVCQEFNQVYTNMISLIDTEVEAKNKELNKLVQDRAITNQSFIVIKLKDREIVRVEKR